MSARVQAICVPWFNAETWPRLLAVAGDRARLPDTFAEFERRAGRQLDGLTAQGLRVEKVLVDVNQLVAWCRAEGRPLDGMARAAFAALAVARRDAMH